MKILFDNIFLLFVQNLFKLPCVALFLTLPPETKQKQPDKTFLLFILRRVAFPRGTCLLFAKVSPELLRATSGASRTQLVQIWCDGGAFSSLHNSRGSLARNYLSSLSLVSMHINWPLCARRRVCTICKLCGCVRERDLDDNATLHLICPQFV